MSEDQDYLMKQRRKEILVADRWRCILCEMPIDRSHVSSDDEKDSLLRAHLNETHLGSPLFNKDMKEEYHILYFKPIIETIQPNQKFQ
jgi:thiamine monophosphate synthase